MCNICGEAMCSCREVQTKDLRAVAHNYVHDNRWRGGVAPEAQELLLTVVEILDRVGSGNHTNRDKREAVNLLVGLEDVMRRMQARLKYPARGEDRPERAANYAPSLKDKTPGLAEAKLATTTDLEGLFK
jgi:hypothetical protein